MAVRDDKGERERKKKKEEKKQLVSRENNAQIFTKREKKKIGVT
jgi:hypothetical protein